MLSSIPLFETLQNKAHKSMNYKGKCFNEKGDSVLQDKQIKNMKVVNGDNGQIRISTPRPYMNGQSMVDLGGGQTGSENIVRHQSSTDKADTLGKDTVRGGAAVEADAYSFWNLMAGRLLDALSEKSGITPEEGKTVIEYVKKYQNKFKEQIGTRLDMDTVLQEVAPLALRFRNKGIHDSIMGGLVPSSQPKSMFVYGGQGGTTRQVNRSIDTRNLDKLPEITAKSKEEIEEIEKMIQGLNEQFDSVPYQTERSFPLAPLNTYGAVDRTLGIEKPLKKQGGSYARKKYESAMESIRPYYPEGMSDEEIIDDIVHKKVETEPDLERIFKEYQTAIEEFGKHQDISSVPPIECWIKAAQVVDARRRAATEQNYTDKLNETMKQRVAEEQAINDWINTTIKE